MLKFIVSLRRWCHVWEKYGYCYEENEEIYMEGLDGAARMAALMDSLRNDPPKSFGGVAVEMIADYKTGVITKNGEITPTGLPSSNVLYYQLENGDVIVARPSGTEPKIKYYYMLSAKDRDDAKEKIAQYRTVLSQRA